MKKLIPLVSVGVLFTLLLFVETPVVGQGDRASSLEGRVAKLEQRVDKLERYILEQTISAKPGTSVRKGLEAWRRLKKGMTEGQVRSILGEPQRVVAGLMTRWHYSGGGSVQFIRGDIFGETPIEEVYGWSEP